VAWTVVAAFALFMVTVAGGCVRAPARRPLPSAPQPAQGPALTLFFPVQPGLKWQYQGTGNEFATFSQETVRSQGDKVQVRRDSGATVGILYSVTAGAVTRLIRKELAEDRDLLTAPAEENVVVLKAPLVIGTTWTNGTETRSIISTGVVLEVPAGTFQDVIKVQVTIQGQTAQTFEYYARDVGLVKVEYVSGETRIVSDLKLFSKGKVDPPKPAPAPAAVPSAPARVPPIAEAIRDKSITQAENTVKVSFKIVRTYEPTVAGNRAVTTEDNVVVTLIKEGEQWKIESIR
jgi:hypothetical protein